VTNRSNVVKETHTLRAARKPWTAIRVEFDGRVCTARELAQLSGFHLKTIREWHAAGRLERGYVELRMFRRDLLKQARALGINDSLLRTRLMRGKDPLAPVGVALRRAS
jgi:hypothetical protein